MGGSTNSRNQVRMALVIGMETGHGLSGLGLRKRLTTGFGSPLGAFGLKCLAMWRDNVSGIFAIMALANLRFLLFEP